MLTELMLEIFRVNGTLLTNGDELVKELGLTSARWKVLGALSLSGEPMTVAQIAKVMGQTRQGVQRLADVMERDGLITYKENPFHKKAKLAELTPLGIELYAKAHSRQVPWANGLSEGLGEEELYSALEVLKKLREKL